MLPAFSSGQWAGTVAPTWAAVGSGDFLFMSGGGIMGHPDGPEAGVASVKRRPTPAPPHTVRFTQPRSSSRVTACEMRGSDPLAISAISLIRSVASGTTDSRARIM